MLRFLTILPFVLLIGCTSTSGYLLIFYADEQPSPAQFELCHGYSCRYKEQVSLTAANWQAIERLFSNNTGASMERNQIAKAIALLETQAGEKSGIKNDLPKSLKTKDTHGQQDCIDETVNTTTYLRMMQSANLLRWHRVAKPIRRGYFVDRRWPHNSATIQETDSGQLYAVDSWPRANGEAPDIMLAEDWYAGGR